MLRVNSSKFLFKPWSPALKHKKNTLISKRFFSNPDVRTISDPDQFILAGKGSIDELAITMKGREWNPLIVTDHGVEKAGILNIVKESFTVEGLKFDIWAKTKENPPLSDVKEISHVVNKTNRNCIVALGGGGPMDAAKAALLYLRRSNGGYSLAPEGQIDPVINSREFFDSLNRNGKYDSFAQSLPPLICIPTTSGTGSEGGKSAVITYGNVKKIVGSPCLLPKYVALDPRLTASMPPKLTFATGIDALFHCLEAYFVTEEEAMNQGMDKELIDRCDEYAINGIRLVLENLPKAFNSPSDLTARLNMQIAALYGAKAFRKGDLGGVHATAHSIGATYHLHHGESIARMSVPVLMYNEMNAEGETKRKFSFLNQIFNELGFKGKTLPMAISELLKDGGIEYGLRGLNINNAELDVLSDMAANDPCSTNPIKMTKESYKEVFKLALNNPYTH